MEMNIPLFIYLSNVGISIFIISRIIGSRTLAFAWAEDAQQSVIIGGRFQLTEQQDKQAGTSSSTQTFEDILVEERRALECARFFARIGRNCCCAERYQRGHPEYHFRSRRRTGAIAVIGAQILAANSVLADVVGIAGPTRDPPIYLEKSTCSTAHFSSPSTWTFNRPLTRKDRLRHRPYYHYL